MKKSEGQDESNCVGETLPSYGVYINDFLSIEHDEVLIVIHYKLTHIRNAQSEIVLVFCGISIFFKLIQLPKAK